MYKVILSFIETHHGSTLYEVGDTYPKKGHKLSEERANQLVTGKNKTGGIYLEYIPDEKPKPLAKKTIASK